MFMSYHPTPLQYPPMSRLHKRKTITHNFSPTPPQNKNLPESNPNVFLSFDGVFVIQQIYKYNKN